MLTCSPFTFMFSMFCILLFTLVWTLLVWILGLWFGPSQARELSSTTTGWIMVRTGCVLAFFLIVIVLVFAICGLLRFVY